MSINSNNIAQNDRLGVVKPFPTFSPSKSMKLSLTLNKNDKYEPKVKQIQKNFNHINPISG